MNQFCPRSVEEAVKFHSLIVVENPLKTYQWVTLLRAFLLEHKQYIYSYSRIHCPAAVYTTQETVPNKETISFFLGSVC